MFNLIDFISQYRIMKGVPTNIYSLEPYIAEFGYSVDYNKLSLILSSRQIGSTTLLKSTALYYLINNHNVLFVDNNIRNCKTFIHDIKILIEYLNHFFNNIGLEEYEFSHSKTTSFELNTYKIHAVTSLIDLRSHDLNNSVVLFDNACDNKKLFDFLSIIFTSDLYKVIINSCNSIPTSQFNNFFNNPDYGTWNKIKLDYTLNSRIFNKENELRVLYGDDRFNKDFCLK